MPTDETYYDDQTLITVAETLEKMGYDIQEVYNMITELQNAGILLRERA